jgi:hypothetical protein
MILFLGISLKNLFFSFGQNAIFVSLMVDLSSMHNDELCPCSFYFLEKLFWAGFFKRSLNLSQVPSIKVNCRQ